eukprot:RCo009196
MPFRVVSTALTSVWTQPFLSLRPRGFAGNRLLSTGVQRSALGGYCFCGASPEAFSRGRRSFSVSRTLQFSADKPAASMGSSEAEPSSSSHGHGVGEVSGSAK